MSHVSARHVEAWMRWNHGHAFNTMPMGFFKKEALLAAGKAQCSSFEENRAVCRWSGL